MSESQTPALDQRCQSGPSARNSFVPGEGRFSNNYGANQLKLCRPIHFGLRNDDIQEFDSKWDGILLSMTKIPLDDILEGLYKLRIREFEKLKTVLELYDIITDWKQWWKEVSGRTYEIWILAPEMEIKKETPWWRIREQNNVYREFLEIVGNGSPTGSVLEETIAVSDTIRISVEKRHSQIRLRILSCSRMREMRRELKVRDCKDHL